MKKILLILAVMALTGGLIFNSYAAEPKYGGVMRVIPLVCPGGPIGWPAEAVGEVGNLQQYALEPLVREYWDGHYEPILAKEWESDPDKLSITFKLRKGVKFHDGTDFNAKAVLFNFQALIDAKTRSAAHWESLEVIDDYTIRIHFKNWRNTHLAGFASGGTFIVSPTAFEKNGLEWMRENIVGTGPFKFVSFERDVNAKFVKNKNYWQKGKPYLDGVEIIYIKEAFTKQAAMQSHEADVLQTELDKTAADLHKLGFKMISRTTGMVVLIPDSKNPESPFSDKRVREALEYAVDKEAIVKAKGFGFLHPSYQLPAEGTLAYNPKIQGRRYDPEKAKKLLAEAGYPNGFKYRIIITPTGMDRDMMVAVKSNLEKVGIQVDLDFVEYAKYLDYRHGSWSGALLAQPTGIWPNYNFTVLVYWSPNSALFGSLQRPKGLGDLFVESSSLKEVNADKLKEMVNLIYEDATVIPLYDTGQGAVVQDYVHDTGFLALGVHFLCTPEQAWFSK